MFGVFKKRKKFLPKIELQDFVVLLAGASVFTAIAASTVTKFSIWFDEAFGSYLIRFDYFELTRYTAYDVHPPLYYWLLKTWSLLFGNTELGIRSMSIFFGVVTIVFVFMLTMRLFGRKTAYVTLLLLVLSPLFIRYSQEARMYTLLTAIIVAATYVLVYAQEHAKKRSLWILYGVLLALGMLTQYFAALAWLGHWVWRAITIKQDGRSFKKAFFTRNWVTAHVVAFVVFLPWLPLLVLQFINVQGNGFWIPPVSSTTIPDFFTNFLLFMNHDGAISWLAAGCYIVFISLIYIMVKTYMRLHGQQRNDYLLVICMVVVPIVILFVMSMPPLRPAFVDRYLMATIVFLPILLGASIVYASAFIRRKLLIGLTFIIVVMMVIGIGVQMTIGNYNKSTNQSNDVRELVEKVREKAPANTPIIGNTPWIFYEAVIYSRSDSTIYFINETTNYQFGSLKMLVENDEYKIMDLDKFTHEHPSFWVIANLRDGSPNKVRDTWKINDTITINDDVSHQPLFRAIHVTVE